MESHILTIKVKTITRGNDSSPNGNCRMDTMSNGHFPERSHRNKTSKTCKLGTCVNTCSESRHSRESVNGVRAFAHRRFAWSIKVHICYSLMRSFNFEVYSKHVLHNFY